MFSRFRQRRRIKTLRPTPIGKLGDAGETAVKAKVRQAGALLKSPLTGRSCVFYSVDLSEWQNGTKTPFLHTTSFAPFYLEDDTGRILVDPSNKVDCELRRKRKEGHSSDYPSEMRGLVLRNELGMLDEYGELRSLSFREFIVVPGDTITALGILRYVIDPEGTGSYREPPRERVLGGDSTHRLLLGH